MRKFLLFAIGLLLLPGLLAPAARGALAEEAAEATVRVRLSVGRVERISVAVEGSYECLGKQFSGGTLSAEARGGGVVLRHSEAGLLGRGDSVTVLRRETSVWAAFLTLDNTRYGQTRYLGDMIFANDGHGRLMLVNRVGMTAYLCGVVGGELRDAHPEEALKAQAVAAKCFALTCLDAAEPYDLDDTPTDQVYKGYQPADERIMAAVDAVAGDLLTCGGEVVRCYYCTSNGGQTITPRQRWGKESGPSGVYRMAYDPYDLEGAPDAALIRVQPDAHDLPEALYAFLLECACEQAAVLAIDTVQSFRGLRADDAEAGLPDALAPQAMATVQLLCTLQDGGQRTLECAFPLHLLAERGIADCPEANTWFVMPEDDGSWTVVFSRAIGHRVGMSHYGLLRCAELGFTYDEILAFYYPGATLTHDDATAPSPTLAPLTPAPDAPQPTVTPAPAVIPYATPAGEDFWETLFAWAR